MGHRRPRDVFSHYKYYDKCFEDLMGNDFQLNMRECWVRMFNTWVPYPFQNNIRYLPKEVTSSASPA